MPEVNESSVGVESETTAVAVVKAPRKRAPKKVASEVKNKMSLARPIFKSLNRGKNGPDRQKVLKAFQERVGLTKAGASTYYQKLKTELASKKSA